MSLINNSNLNSQHFYCPQHICHLPALLFLLIGSSNRKRLETSIGFLATELQHLGLWQFFVLFNLMNRKQRTKKQHGERMNQIVFFKIKVVSKNKTLSKASTVDRSCFENGKSQPILTANIGMVFARPKVSDLQNACKEMLHVKAPKKNETQLIIPKSCKLQSNDQHSTVFHHSEVSQHF